MDIVTIKELSEFLKVKPSTLYSWVHGGTIPFYKLNGLLRFDMNEILRWIEASKPEHRDTRISLKNNRNQDINSIVKSAIDSVKGKGYNSSKRETSLGQGLRKEG